MSLACLARPLRIALAAAAFSWAGLAAAQAAERPQVRPGDRWDFVVWYATPSTTPNRRWVVESVSPTLVTAREDGEPLLLTSELNPVDSPLLRQSNAQLLRFPLKVGERWHYVNEVRFKDNNSTASVDTAVAVTAYEWVRVPAGEFEAFRLEAKGRIQGRSKGGPGVLEGESRATYWYAPAARAIVRSRNWSTYRGAATTELVDFALRP